MKFTFAFLAFFFVSSFFSQNVIIAERNAAFSSGSKNAIIITIPYTTVEFGEKAIKDELKNWGGKSNSSKGEFSTYQSQTKELGEKLFDSYAKIIEAKDGNITIAFAIDLGGAYLSSSIHKEQFTAFSNRLKTFAIKTSKESVSEELKNQEKILKDHQKFSENLEKDKATLEANILDYKKKIEEASAKIEKNKVDQAKKKEEIKAQEIVVGAINKKFGEIK